MTVMRALACALTFVVACSTFSSTDPSSPDGGSVVDGGASDGGSADASKRFCEAFVPPKGTVHYCRDFDDGKPPNDDWTSVDIGPARTMTSDTTTNVSPPASLLARLDANGPGCASARAMKNIEKGLSPVTRIAFDVRVGGGSGDVKDGARFFYVEISPTARLSFEVTQDGEQRWRAFLYFDPVQAEYALANAPQMNAWAHFDITLRKPTNDLQVNIDGKAAFGPSPMKPGFMAAGVKLDIAVGPDCDQPASFTREVRMDNLVVVGSDD